MGHMHRHVGWRWELLLDAVALTTVVAELARQLTTGVSAETALVLGASALVGLRRWAPMSAGVGAVLVSALALANPMAALPVWILAEICLFSLPLRRRAAATVSVGIAHAAVLYVGALVVFHAEPLDPLALILPVWTPAVLAAGAAVRSHHDYLTAFRAQTRSEASAREARVLQHVEEERLRIARDLHDSVANSVAVMTINAASARRNLAADPNRAVRELEQVQRSGVGVLREMTDILTVLRRDMPGQNIADDRTLPTAAGIPGVVEAMRSTGLIIDAHIMPLPAVDPAVDAALYRCMQEALTNAQRHGSSPVAVELRADGTAVTLRVSNPVNSLPPVAPSSGFGLIGMKERVQSAGGTLSAGAQDGIFVVDIRFTRDGREPQEERGLE